MVNRPVMPNWMVQRKILAGLSNRAFMSRKMYCNSFARPWIMGRNGNRTGMPGWMLIDLHTRKKQQNWIVAYGVNYRFPGRLLFQSARQTLRGWQPGSPRER